MRIAYANFHSIEERASLELYTSLGHEVVSLGAYLIPREPGDPKRPPLDIDPPPDEIVAACRDTHAAKFHYPDVLLEWLGRDGVLISHHFLPETVFNQWDRLRAWGGRVIWRSDGQSSPDLERTAQYFRGQGLERVAYSPLEANLPYYAGHDAIIRFGYDPDEWTGWTGSSGFVINVTQNLAQRGSATNYEYWQQATSGLKALPLGPGSDAIGGPGELTYAEMQQWLRDGSAYLYTGTQPAPYTLGLIEAGMTGIPIVSIGSAWMNQPALFEASDLVPLGGFDDPQAARRALAHLLSHPDEAQRISTEQRAFFVKTFGLETVTAQWKSYLESRQ